MWPRQPSRVCLLATRGLAVGWYPPGYAYWRLPEGVEEGRALTWLAGGEKKASCEGGGCSEPKTYCPVFSEELAMSEDGYLKMKKRGLGRNPNQKTEDELADVKS